MTLQFLKVHKKPFPVGKNAFFVVNITDACYIIENKKAKEEFFYHDP